MKARGRPRKFDRDDAVRIALRMFQARGYEGTSIADLTEAIGVSPTSLYGVFASKEALFEEAVDLYQRTEGAFAAEALQAAGTVHHAIRELLMGAAKQYPALNGPGGCFISLGILSCAVDHESIAARMRERRLQAREAIRVRLEVGKTAGELHPGADTVALASYFATTLQGMSVQARDGATEEDLAGIALVALAALGREATT